MKSPLALLNMLFNTYNQHSPFLSPNYTCREALHGEQTVLCAHCLRRDARWSTPTQRPTWEFPTLSLRSHSPPGEASCTQQQGAPPLTPRCPSGHTAGPGPSSLTAEWRGYSQSQKWSLRALVLNVGSRSDLLHCERTWD